MIKLLHTVLQAVLILCLAASPALCADGPTGTPLDSLKTMLEQSFRQTGIPVTTSMDKDGWLTFGMTPSKGSKDQCFIKVKFFKDLESAKTEYVNRYSSAGDVPTLIPFADEAFSLSTGTGERNYIFGRTGNFLFEIQAGSNIDTDTFQNLASGLDDIINKQNEKTQDGNNDGDRKRRGNRQRDSQNASQQEGGQKNSEGGGRGGRSRGGNGGNNGSGRN